MRWVAMPLVALACSPQHPTPQGVAVTGACAHTLTEQDRADLDSRIANARQCMHEHGFKVRNRVREIRVHCGCPQFRDRIELEWRRHDGHSASRFYDGAGLRGRIAPQHFGGLKTPQENKL